MTNLTTDYLKGLENLTFIEAKDKAIYCAEGFHIKLHTNFNSFSNELKEFPIQIVLRVLSSNNKPLSFWGATNNEENGEIAHWFYTKYYKLKKETVEAEDRFHKSQEILFKEITCG
jgi:hypothetical protein